MTIASRDDHKQSQMRARFPEVRFHSMDLGNVSSYAHLLGIVGGHDYCIHAAAAKIVSEGEYKPFTQLNTNVLGTLYILQAWRQVHGDCKRFLYINSDKAVSPLTTYGFSKGLAAALVRAPDYNGSTLRYGNVVGSNGSFISTWQKQASLSQPIRVRWGKPSGDFPTRFFLTMSQAVDLVNEAMGLMGAGETGVFLPPGLPAFSIKDVADATGLPVLLTGIEPAEKMHEVLLAPGEGWEKTGSKALVRRTLCHWPEDDYYAPFRSNTAQRLTGADVLGRLEWART